MKMATNSMGRISEQKSSKGQANRKNIYVRKYLSRLQDAHYITTTAKKTTIYKKMYTNILLKEFSEIN